MLYPPQTLAKHGKVSSTMPEVEANMLHKRRAIDRIKDV